MAMESRPRIRTGFSSRTLPPRLMAAVWGCGSRNRSCTPTAERCASKAYQVRERRSSSHYRFGCCMDKSRIHILVVEDEPGLCAGIQEALQREGYPVATAGDGPKAIERLDRRLYNLVISDVRLPGTNGVELMAHVKARSPDTIVILMTAYGTVNTAVEAMKQGAYDYLPKPLDMRRLRVLVGKALEYQGGVAENKR